METNRLSVRHPFRKNKVATFVANSVELTKNLLKLSKKILML